MAIKVKSERKGKFGWPFFLFIISCLALLFFVSSYIFFDFNIKETEEKIDELSQQIQGKEELQEELVAVEEKLAQVEGMLIGEGIVNLEIVDKINNEKECQEANLYWFNNICYEEAYFSELKIERAYRSLQESVHPNVWFSNFKLNAENNEISIGGTAEDLTSFKQQVNILGEKLNNFNLTGYSILEDERVSFNFVFKIDTQKLP